MAEWLRMAFDFRVVSRALKYAFVVGLILVVINHGDDILNGDISVNRLFKIGLTVVVPYVVSTCSSVGALRDLNTGRRVDRP